MNGYFNIHRQIFDSWVFADDKALKIWIWLIGKARHKKGFIPLKVGKGTITIELKVGQMLFGRHKAEESLCLDGSLIYRKLKKFEEDKMIKIESNNQYSIITICKYVDYQQLEEQNEQPTNNQRTAGEQPSNTNNNYNNYNKENNILFEGFKKITGKNIRVFDDKAKRQFHARLKEGYSVDEILKAIKNCNVDKYHIENPKFLTLEFITRSDKLSKYLLDDKSHSLTQDENLPSHLKGMVY